MYLETVVPSPTFNKTEIKRSFRTKLLLDRVVNVRLICNYKDNTTLLMFNTVRNSINE